MGITRQTFLPQQISLITQSLVMYMYAVILSILGSLLRNLCWFKNLNVEIFELTESLIKVKSVWSKDSKTRTLVGSIGPVILDCQSAVKL